ncbi:MAG TPA: RagB/SusD family nutrient uptake outer membrane protein [Gemmatimonadaceae bacterium]
MTARRAAAGLLACALAATTACNSLLSVDNPGNVPADALADPNLVSTLEVAAIQTFQCGAVNYAASVGMLSGEYWSSNGFVDNHPWEWRGVVEIKGAPGSCATTRTTTAMGFYTPLQQARFQAEDAGARFASFSDAQVPNRQRFMVEMKDYAGYALLLLGEGMCEMTVDNGPKMTRQDTYALAEKHFTDAIAAIGAATDNAFTAADRASLKNMALVGRARARLDAGNLTGAADDAGQVPAGFVRVAEFSEVNQGRENRIYNLTVRSDNLSTAPAYQGLTLENGAPDPRVKVTDMKRKGPDNVTPMFQQQKFTGSGSVALPIASYAEAQLILAEAVGGQAGLDAINRVRALSSIPPLASAGPDFEATVLEERRRQLFSEGQHYGDMLRKNLPFPSGVNRKGQTISNLTCVPLPDVETRNNPNFKS